MGRLGMAEKRRNPVTQGGGHRRVRRPDPSAFDGGWLVVALLPGWRVYQEGGRKCLPRLTPDWPENRSKRPSSGSTSLGEFFSRVLVLKMSVLGLGFYLARKTMLYRA